MTEKQFNNTRFHKVMTHSTFNLLELRLQKFQTLPYPLSVTNYFQAKYPTNLLTQLVLFWLRSEGHYCFRQNNQGTARKMKDGRIMFVPGSKYAKGQADIQAIIGGCTIYIEIKARATMDKLTDHQRRFRDMVTKAGAQYWIVTMMEDLLEHYKPLINDK